jgi:fibronectin type 3 domain-containing protein
MRLHRSFLGTTLLAAVALSTALAPAASAAPAFAPPPAPTGLGAAGADGQVTLTWNAVPGATSYSVRRATTSGGPYATIALGVGATSFVNSGLVNGTTYYYVVRAVNGDGQSGNSNQAQATPGIVVPPPPAPAGLVASAGNGQVVLTWGASAGATSYTVRRSTASGGPFSDIQIGVAGTTFTNTGLANGTTYYYVVVAVNEGGPSGNSNTASATPTGPPVAPTGLSATAGDGQVQLNWTGSAGATSYTVARSSTAGGPYVVVQPGVAGTSYLNIGLTNGTTYFYVVRAAAAAGESPNSNEASATPSNGAAVPAAPVLTATPGNGQVVLTWTGSAGATNYIVQRSGAVGGPFITVVTVPTTSYTHLGLTNGTPYFFRVIATNSGGQSPASNVASATPSLIPAPPTLAATPGSGSINLTWNAVPGATSYTVRRSPNAVGPFGTIASVGGTSYVDAPLAGGVTFYYVVRAVNAFGQSANSNVASATVTTLPPTISGFAPALGGTVGSNVTITGTNLAGATSVTFNGTAAVIVTALPNQLTVTVPPGATTGLISVTTPGGTVQSSTFKVLPKIDNFVPTSGVVGTSVTINGSALKIGATVPTVRFNGIVAAVSASSYGQVTATVPATATTGTITVTTADGVAVSATPFTVFQPPTISNFAPPSGAVGTSVTINGNNFTVGTTSVSFNGLAGVITLLSPSQITVIVPANATTGPVSVTTPGGTAVGSAFTVLPQISNFTPLSGIVGTSVTINGTALKIGATTPTVQFGAVAASVTASSYSQITALVPAGATTNRIFVTTADGTAQSAVDFTVIQPPTISNFAPPSAVVGTVVTINGNNFAGALDVSFNGLSAVFTLQSPIQITATVPNGGTSGPISVTTPGGTAVSGSSFTVLPQISNFTPPSGIVGTSVTINGTALKVGAATPIVEFGSVSAVVTASSYSQITTSVPAGAVTDKIRVTTADGVALSIADFIVPQPPTISDFTPLSGVVGTLVTINGQNFLGTAAVRFNGVSATFTLQSDIQITATLPIGATTGPVSVQNGAGTGTSGVNFVVLPKITSFTPATGNVGTQVTITGNNLLNATAVTFNFLDAQSFIVDSDTQIRAIVPAGNATGLIRVVAGGNTAVSSTVFEVPPPAPDGLVGSPGNQSASLVWNATPGATSYDLLRSLTSGSGFAFVKNVSVNATSDSPLTNGTAYFYVVQARNAAGVSGNSNEVSVIPAAAPPAPTGLVASRGNGSVRLDWNPTLTAVNYNAYVSANSGGPYTVPFTSTPFTTTTAGGSNGTTFYYIVRAVNQVGVEGPPSNEAHATPIAGPMVQSSDPWDGMPDVALGSHLRLTFTEQMNKLSVETSLGVVSVPGPNPAPLSFFWDTPAVNPNGTIVTVVLGPGLLPEAATITATLGVGAQSASGVPLPSAYQTRFTTRVDATPPSINFIRTHPVPQDPRFVVLSNPVTELRVQFNEPMNTGFGSAQTQIQLGHDQGDFQLEASVGNPTPQMTLQWVSNVEVSIVLASPLKPNTAYRLQINNLQDVFNNWLNVEDVTLITQRTPAGPAPVLVGSAPYDNQTGVSLNSNIIIAVSELMTPTFPNDVTVTGAGIPVRKEYDGSELRIIPLMAWPANTEITVNFGPGSPDNSGTSFVHLPIKFTTGAGSAADLNPIVLDEDYSTLKQSLTDRLDTWNFFGFARFRDSAGRRAILNEFTFTPGMVTITESDTGIPVKGFIPRIQERTLISLMGGTGIQGLQNNTLYTVSFTNSFISSTLINSPQSYQFRTVTAAQMPRVQVQGVPEVEVQMFGASGGPFEAQARLRASVNQPGSTATLSIQAQDLQNPLFIESQSSPPSQNWFEFQFENQPETRLTTPPNDHVMQFTFGNGVAPNTILNQRYYMFSSFPTLNAPDTTPGVSTPRYSWTGIPAAADAIFIHVQDQSNNIVLRSMVNRDAVEFFHPAGRALPPGDYYIALGVIRFEDGVIGSDLGEALIFRPYTVAGSLPAPTGLTADPENNKVVLRWEPVLGATGYKIKRFNTVSTMFEVIDTTDRTRYEDSSVVNGTNYQYRVCAVSSAGDTPDSLTANATPVGPPATAPSNLVATPGDNQVGLTWNAVVGATSYIIKRAPFSGGFYNPIALSGTTSYTDLSVVNGVQVFYRVSAVTPGGEGPDSAFQGATPAGPPLPPSVIQAVSGNALVVLYWAASDFATFYEVESSATSGGTFTLLQTVNSPALTFTHGGLPNGTPVFYRVRAGNGSGTSAPSSEATATPTIPPPAPPTGLNAGAGNGQISLTWNSSGAPLYRVKRSTTGSSGPYAMIAVVASPAFLDTALPNGVTFFYVVSSANAGGESAESSSASATPTGPPPAPGSLTATGIDGAANLSWTAASGATSYKVFQSLTSGSYGAPVQTGVVGTTTTVNGLVNDTTYFFVVRATNAGGDSGNSNEATATPNGPPPAPTNVVATPGDSQVTVSWTAEPTALTYNVKRSTVFGGPYGPIQTGVGGTVYVDSTASNGTTYFYMVSGVNGAGEGPDSTPPASATPQQAPSINFQQPPNNPSPFSGQPVTRGTHLELGFTMPMNTATFNNSTVTITPGVANPNPIQFYWTGSTTVTLVFDTQLPAGVFGDDVLAAGTNYDVHLNGVQSGTGIAMPSTHCFFTTQTQNPQPTFALTPDPANPVTAGTNQLVVTWSVPMQTTQGRVRVEGSYGYDATLDLNGPDNGISSFNWTVGNTVLTINLTAGLPGNNIYRVEVDNFQSTGNQPFNGGDHILLVTPGPAGTPPTATGMIPSGTAPRDSTILLGFSATMWPADLLDPTKVVISGAPGVVVDRELVDFSGIMLHPRSAWPAGGTITVTVMPTVRNAAGTPVGGAAVPFSFTAAAQDTTAMTVDSAFSTIATFKGHVDLDRFSFRQKLQFLRGGGQRAFVNQQTLAPQDVSLFESGSNIPLKGFSLRGEGGLEIQSDGGFTGMKFSTPYVLRFNPSFQNSEGGIMETAGNAHQIAFTTRSGAGVARPEFRGGSGDSRYFTAANGVLAELSMNVSSPTGQTLTVTAEDSVNTAFNKALSNGGGPNSNYEYDSNGTPEPDLTTPGPREVTYDVADGTHFIQLAEKMFFFDRTLYPSLTTGTGTTPTLSWGAPPPGVSGMAVIIKKVGQNNPAYLALLNPAATQFIVPADQALQVGQQYEFFLHFFHAIDGAFIGATMEGDTNPSATFVP